MTKAEYEAMDLDELTEWAWDNLDCITTEESLIGFAKCKIDSDDLFLAIHILNAIYDSEEAYHRYYRYDYNMGTLETPTPITCKEDIEDLLFFDDEV